MPPILYHCVNAVSFVYNFCNDLIHFKYLYRVRLFKIYFMGFHFSYLRLFRFVIFLFTVPFSHLFLYYFWIGCWLLLVLKAIKLGLHLSVYKLWFSKHETCYMNSRLLENSKKPFNCLIRTSGHVPDGVLLPRLSLGKFVGIYFWKAETL